MSMRDRIISDLKTAMKARSEIRVATLRLANAAIKERDIAARTAAADGGVSDDDVLALLAKMIKQREESAQIYERGGRLELADRERAEIDVIREYMPKQLDAAETEAAVAAAVKSTGAASLKDMGKVMGALKAQYAGQLDFGKAGKLVKTALGGH